jgi:uncharacterized membrane protein YfcA
MDVTAAGWVLIALASAAAGTVNAVAGGGTLVIFPAMTAVGYSTLSANIATTVGLNPGYFGGALAQRRDLQGQRARLLRLFPVAMAGGACGALLLLHTTADLFSHIVPWLIFFACGLLAAQNRIRAAVERRDLSRTKERHPTGAGPVVLAIVFVGAVYGGYFGAGLGVVLLGVLGIAIAEDLVRINAIKQVLSLAVNVTASLLLVFSAELPWAATIVMAVFSFLGGSAGGRFATRVQPDVLRRVVIAIGLVVGFVYLVRG